MSKSFKNKNRKSAPKASGKKVGQTSSAVANKKNTVIGEQSKRAFSRGQRRRHLDERLKLLHQRVIIIEDELRKLEENRFYRTCIFGSARIKPETPAYNHVIELARLLASEGIDILTGGGPGLMEAANKGAKAGKKANRNKGLSLGLTIQLEWEPEPNHHLDVKRHHMRFSSRLDDFMRLSHSIIVTPGGIGTVLELFFAWQLIQVKHIEPKPLVFLGKEFWTGLIDWMKIRPLADGLVSAKDFEHLQIVDTPEEAYQIIAKHHQEFRKANPLTE